MSERPQTSSPPAEVTTTEVGVDVGPYRVPRVQRDVIVSRLTIQDPHLSGISLASSLSSSSLSSVSCGEEWDVAPAAGGRLGNAASPAGPVRMPLSSVAKAEAALQKTVSLSKNGLCAEFSVDDIRRIADADVLRYLSTSSGARVGANDDCKTSSDERAIVTAPTTSTSIEAHMAALQREIDTFITAVDNEGRTYEIRIGTSGHVEVPIDDDEREDGVSLPVDKSGADQVASSDVAHRAVPQEEPAEAQEATKSTITPPSSEATLSEVSRGSRSGRRPFPSKPVSSKRSALPLNARVRQQNRLSTSVPLKRPSQSTQLSKDRPPSIPVHPQASLTNGEEARVQELLVQSTVAALAINPFVLGEEMKQRLRILEAEVQRYAAVRGVVVSDGVLEHLDDDAREVSSASKTTVDLGNAYMLQVREQEKIARQRRSVNERLRALQQRAEELAVAPADDLPPSIAALRPSWAQSTAPIVEETEVQRLLELACEEEARAREAGLGGALPPPPADPLEGLHHLMSSTCARAEDLLSLHESSPLVLRSVPALEDISNSESDV